MRIYANARCASVLLCPLAGCAATTGEGDATELGTVGAPQAFEGQGAAGGGALPTSASSAAVSGAAGSGAMPVQVQPTTPVEPPVVTPEPVLPVVLPPGVAGTGGSAASGTGGAAGGAAGSGGAAGGAGMDGTAGQGGTTAPDPNVITDPHGCDASIMWLIDGETGNPTNGDVGAPSGVGPWQLPAIPLGRCADVSLWSNCKDAQGGMHLAISQAIDATTTNVFFLCAAGRVASGAWGSSSSCAAALAANKAYCEAAP